MIQPKPHQVEALTAVMRGFREHARGQVLMACGSGKTLVALWTAEKLGAGRILVLVPSLALVSQLLKEFRAHATWKRWSALAVCSDESVGEDETTVELSELSCPVTMSGQDVEEFLAGTGVRVVFSTYHSCHLLTDLDFELGLFDEAHKTSGNAGKPFGYALKDKNVRIEKRLFLTATPRVEIRKEAQWSTVHSMDDAKIYGPVFYKLPFRLAVEAGIICDYHILISEVSEDVDVGQAAIQVAIQKAMDTYGIKKAFTFHRTVTGAAGFCDVGGFSKNVRTYHVNGHQTSGLRAEILTAFRGADTAVLTNARCLTEGVDVPAVGLVAFVEPKRATVDVVQAVGRACRRSGDKTTGYVFLPLFRRVKEGETVDAAIERSQFRTVLNVLQALASQDEMLQDAINGLREKRILGESTEDDALPNITVLSDGDMSLEHLGFLRRAITATLLDSLSGARDTRAKKAVLLRMAKEGKPRPKFTDPPELRHLATALAGYTQKKRSPYDEAFTRKLRAARPDWFITVWANQGKALFLADARGGRPKPKDSMAVSYQERSEAQRLKRYLDHDPEFGAELRRVAPSWVARSSDDNKTKLLELAKSGVPRPSKRHRDPDMARMGALLQNYTSPKSQTYDPAFRAEVIQLGWAPRGRTG